MTKAARGASGARGSEKRDTVRKRRHARAKRRPAREPRHRRATPASSPRRRPRVGRRPRTDRMSMSRASRPSAKAAPSRGRGRAAPPRADRQAERRRKGVPGPGAGKAASDANDTPLERLRDAAIERAAWPELRSAHADARAVAQLVGPVEEVHEHEAPLELSQTRKHQGLDKTEVHVRIAGKVLGVGEATPQAAAVEQVGGERGVAPLV